MGLREIQTLQLKTGGKLKKKYNLRGKTRIIAARYVRDKSTLHAQRLRERQFNLRRKIRNNSSKEKPIDEEDLKAKEEWKRSGRKRKFKQNKLFPRSKSINAISKVDKRGKLILKNAKKSNTKKTAIMNTTNSNNESVLVEESDKKFQKKSIENADIKSEDADLHSKVEAEQVSENSDIEESNACNVNIFMTTDNYPAGFPNLGKVSSGLFMNDLAWQSLAPNALIDDYVVNSVGSGG